MCVWRRKSQATDSLRLEPQLDTDAKAAKAEDSDDEWVICSEISDDEWVIASEISDDEWVIASCRC